jgi:hypothetical protein
MTLFVRYRILLTCAAFLAGCSHHEKAPSGNQTSFAQRVSHFQTLHNNLQVDELRSYFTKDARIQSPVTPRSGGVEKYISALQAEPYSLQFNNTEVVYSLPRRVATRSEVVARAAGRFDLKERVILEWRADDGYWRISRISFSDWPAIVGTWRRSGLKREGSLELRILPDGTYAVYLSGDYSEPEFRGRYRLESNNIFFADTSAKDPQELQRAEGRYGFVRTSTGIELRKVEDENPWRTERFDGMWSAVP